MQTRPTVVLGGNSRVSCSCRSSGSRMQTRGRTPPSLSPGGRTHSPALPHALFSSRYVYFAVFRCISLVLFSQATACAGGARWTRRRRRFRTRSALTAAGAADEPARRVPGGCVGPYRRPRLRRIVAREGGHVFASSPVAGAWTHCPLATAGRPGAWRGPGAH